MYWLLFKLSSYVRIQQPLTTSFGKLWSQGLSWLSWPFYFFEIVLVMCMILCGLSFRKFLVLNVANLQLGWPCMRNWWQIKREPEGLSQLMFVVILVGLWNPRCMFSEIVTWLGLFSKELFLPRHGSILFLCLLEVGFLLIWVIHCMISGVTLGLLILLLLFGLFGFGAMKEYLKEIMMEWTSSYLLYFLIGVMSIMPLLASLLVVLFYLHEELILLAGTRPW